MSDLSPRPTVRAAHKKVGLARLGFILTAAPLMLAPLLIALLAGEALAQGDAPASFRIVDIKAQGNGCRPGTVGQNISSDQKAFTLTFSEFIAELSATTTKKDERKNCKLTFDTEQDEGWEYAVVGVIFRGASYLDNAVTGNLSVRYGTKGKDARSEMNISGPLDESYVHADQVGVGQLKWNGCQGGNGNGNGNGRKQKTKDFTIDSQLLLKSRDANTQGYFTVDSTDGEIAQTYDVVWRRCDGKSPKNVAVCRIVDSSRPGSSRQLLGKGQGNSAEEALSKARSQLAQRCQREGKSLPRCDVNTAQCSQSSL